MEEPDTPCRVTPTAQQQQVGMGKSALSRITDCRVVNRSTASSVKLYGWRVPRRNRQHHQQEEEGKSEENKTVRHRHRQTIIHRKKRDSPKKGDFNKLKLNQRHFTSQQHRHKRNHTDTDTRAGAGTLTSASGPPFGVPQTSFCASGPAGGAC